MPNDIKPLVFSMLRVVFATVFVVATVAFVSIPYSLGHQPGENQQVSAHAGEARHMT
jgi:hypothetical protein